MTLRKPSKAARRQALHEFLANLPEPPELPDEAEVSTAKEITIVQDGKTLHGSTWVLPQDYSEAEVAAGALPSMKGVSPLELPGFDDQARGVTHDDA